MLALGLMSGTSLDGIDAALIDTDGGAHVVIPPGAALTRPYTEPFRDRLRALFGPSALVDRAAGERRSAAEALADQHAEAVLAVCDRARVSIDRIEVVGFHGQTLYHAPVPGVPGAGTTVQIGDAARLARRIGRPVIADFRSADVAAGGEGAPFVPAFHRALALAAQLPRPVAILNLGGVGNLTWIGGGAEAELLAFDTGPGNGPLDDFVRARTGLACDQDGRVSAAGTADRRVIDALLAHAYFARRAPKSLDRDSFALLTPEAPTMRALSDADGAATLVGAVAACVAAGVALLPEAPRAWFVCGGGRHNPSLLTALRAVLTAPVAPIDTLGWDGDAIEAQAFAYLAVRSLLGLPLSFPGTTGVPRPMPGGRLFDP